MPYMPMPYYYPPYYAYQGYMPPFAPQQAPGGYAKQYGGGYGGYKGQPGFQQHGYGQPQGQSQPGQQAPSQSIGEAKHFDGQQRSRFPPANSGYDQQFLIASTQAPAASAPAKAPGVAPGASDFKKVRANPCT